MNFIHRGELMDKLRVLVIDTVPLMMNGMSTVIMNYYRLCDKEVEMLFVVNKEASNVYMEEFKTNKSFISILKRNNVLSYMFELKKVICQNNIDIVHIHGNSATMIIETLVAQICGIKKIIVHCHNSECSHKVLHRILSPIFKRTYHKSIACSKHAGEWIYGKGKFEVLYNGINVNAFKFSDDIRNNLREKYNLDKKYVIGHVGLFNEQKNHSKLFSVFSEIIKNKPDAMLLCVSGDKEIPEEINLMIRSLQIERNVRIICECENVREMLCAMDVFVFPSKWEGLGIAIIEAEASGLPCVISDRVPLDVDLTNYIKRISLEESDSIWAKEIMDQKVMNKEERLELNKIVLQTKYNIENCKEQLLDVYKLVD